MWWDQYKRVLEQLDSVPAGEINGYVSGDWHEDRETDHELKAWLTANLSIYEETEPNDIMILYKDTDHCRLYSAYRIIRSEDSGQETGVSPAFSLVLLEQGVDYLSFCDLEFAREYALRYLAED